MIREKIRKIFRDEELERSCRELLWANIFHDTIRGSLWLDDNFSLNPGRWAVGYNYLYVVYRLLDEFRPDNILEFGLGQSTKLINRYTNYVQSLDVHHTVIEHDEKWADFFLTNILKKGTVDIKNVRLINSERPYEKGTNSVYYDESDLRDAVGNYKYDFISIDGPFGSEGTNAYSRVDVLNLIPRNLSNNFAIVIDDYNRRGEQKTGQLIFKKLRELGITYRNTVYYGESDLCVIVSESNRFLCTL